MTVSGAINTTNTFSGTTSSPARSGSVFISSGTSINYTSTITAYNVGNSSTSGSVILISAGNGSSITPAPSSNIPANVVAGTGLKGAFTGVGSTSPVTLNSETIAVSPSVAPTNYNPGGYNASSSTVTLTTNTSGDSFAITPLLVFSSSGTPLSLGTVSGSNSGTTDDSFTVVATSNITLNNNFALNGTTSGGSASVFSIGGNINSNFYGNNNSIDTRGLSGPTGGNISILAPLGSYIMRGTYSWAFSTEGTLQAGNILAVTYSRFAVDAVLDTSSAGSAGNVTLMATDNNIFLTGPGQVGTASASNPSRYINATGGTGNGGNITLVVGQSNVGISDPYNIAGSGYSGIVTTSDNIGTTNESSFNTSSTSANAGNINRIVLVGHDGCNPCSSEYSNMQMLATAPNGTGGNVTVSNGGLLDNPHWITQTTGDIGGNISIFSPGSISWRGALVSNSTVGLAGNITMISSNGSASMVNNGYSIASGYIQANGGAVGGNVTVLAPQSTVYFDTSTVNSNNDDISSTGTVQGGNITLGAGSNITISRGINTSSSVRNGGNVNIDITAGNLYFTTSGEGMGTTANPYRFINAQGNAGTGGSITVYIGQTIVDSNNLAGIAITSSNNISTTQESSFNTSSTSGQAGNITVTINQGQWGKFGSSTFADSQFIADSQTGNAGTISITGNGSITLPLLNIIANGANGGNITINSPGAFSTGGYLQADATAVLAGNVTANVGSFTAGYLDVRGGTFGGNVAITDNVGIIAINGAVPTGTSNTHSGDSRNVLIDTSATSKGGSVSLVAPTDIDFNSVSSIATLLAEIDTSSPVAGGNVNIQITGTGNLNLNTYNSSGSTTQRFINTQGGSSNGGNVTISLAQSDGTTPGIFTSVSTYTAPNEASINTSSVSGSAGNITVNIASGASSSATNQGYLQFIANSTSNSAGNISVAVAGAITSNWAFSANGLSGGNISLSSSAGAINIVNGGISGGQGVIIANGSAGNGGNVNISLLNDFTGNYIQTNSGASAGAGGNQVLTSSAGALKLTGSASGSATGVTLSSTGISSGGQITALANGDGTTGISLLGIINASASSGAGGEVSLTTYGPTNANLSFGGSGTTSINVNGTTSGGSMALVTSGNMTFAGSLSATASANGSTGGNIFVSQGGTTNLALTSANTLISGGSGGSSGFGVVMSAGTINGTTSGNLGFYPSISANLMTATYINAHTTDQYQITITPSSQPTFSDTTNPTSSNKLAPGVTLGAGVTMDNVTFVTSSKSFLGPLVVNGNITVTGDGTLTKLLGTGSSAVGLISTGNINLTGANARAINNSNSTGSGGNVSLIALGSVSAIGIDTSGATSSGSGSSGNVAIVGSSVILNASAGSSTNTSATIDTSNLVSNAGSVYISSSGRDYRWKLDRQHPEQLWTDRHVRIRLRQLSRIGCNNFRRADSNKLYLFRRSLKCLRQRRVRGYPGSAIVGSLVNRSTTNASVNGTAGSGGFLNYNSDTGSGTSAALTTAGQYSFLSGGAGPATPVILTDASNGTASTSGINLTLAASATPPSQIVTVNATGSSGPVAVFANNTNANGGLPLGLVHFLGNC